MNTKTNQTTICHSLLKMKERGSAIAVQFKKHGHWNQLSWLEYYEKICLTASALLHLEITEKDPIAIMANTRLEWALCDYAIMGVGAITVPIYQNSTPEDIEFILNNSEAKIIFIENKSSLVTIQNLKDKLPHLQFVICFNNEIVTTDDFCMTWGDFISKGSKNYKENVIEFENRCLRSNQDQMASLIYTSGTTGLPKGVVLRHEQIISEVGEAFPYVGAMTQDISLSFLPYAHVLGRIEHWGHVYIGFQMAFAESIDRVRQNLTEIRPTFLMSVPRIFEKIFSAIQSQLGNNPLKKKLFRWAINVGLKAGKYRLNKEPIPAPLFAQFEIADRLVLHKIREAFGGRLRFAVSGGAPIAREIEEFFHACQILILEGYGLTETTAAICVNTPFDYSFGSVGKPIGDVELKIADDGEILVKSKKVMREYWKDVESTNSVFIDGWFKTGDIGEILSSGDLRITDRKKDLIKTAGGKYVAPQKLENLLKTQPLISQAVIHGDNQKYIVALIALDFPSLKSWGVQMGINDSVSCEDLTQNPKILECVRKSIADVNAELASYETIKRFSILPVELTIENGDLTPSLKVKRKFLEKKYNLQIRALYS